MFHHWDDAVVQENNLLVTINSNQYLTPSGTSRLIINENIFAKNINIHCIKTELNQPQSMKMKRKEATKQNQLFPFTIHWLQLFYIHNSHSSNTCALPCFPTVAISARKFIAFSILNIYTAKKILLCKISHLFADRMLRISFV